MLIKGLRFNQNRFAYPGSFVRPGIDQSNPAAHGCSLSLIADNIHLPTGTGAMHNLMNMSQKTGLLSGTGASGLDSAVGPFVSAAASGSNSITGQATNILHNFTYACIMRSPSSIGALPLFVDANSTTFGVLITHTAASVLELSKNSGGTLVSSGLPATVVSVPYFICVSSSDSTTNGRVTFVMRRLDTGKIFSAVVTSAVAITVAATSTWMVIGSSSQGVTGVPKMAAIMMNPTVAISVDAILKWADDPWSFWYPDKTFAVSQTFMQRAPIASRTIGVQFSDLPAQPDRYQRDLRSWAWQYNPNLIGQDRLPFRNMSNDLPLRLFDPFAQWRSWASSYNPNLIGQDVLPFRNQQEIKPGPFWRVDSLPTNTLIDLLQTINALPIGAQLYDLPQRIADPFGQLRTWAWSYNVNLIGQDVLPFRNLQDVPIGRVWRADSISQNLLGLFTPISLPAGMQWYDRPLVTVPFREFPQPWMGALLTAQVVPLPPGQAYFTLPILGPQQLSPTTMVNLMQTTLAPTLPTFTAVYNTLLLSIPGGMFSIPGDPPS